MVGLELFCRFAGSQSRRILLGADVAKRVAWSLPHTHGLAVCRQSPSGGREFWGEILGPSFPRRSRKVKLERPGGMRACASGAAAALATGVVVRQVSTAAVSGSSMSPTFATDDVLLLEGAPPPAFGRWHPAS